METEINTSDLAVISTRQRVCHICKHEGTLCDTGEGEIVLPGGDILQVDELNTLVADFDGEPICEFCIDA